MLGVTAAEGSFIDKAISLTAPSHLFVLSPGGIQMMPGARFLQIPQLTLSTASELHFPGGVFDVFKTHKAGLSSLDSDPLSGSLGLHGSRNGDDRPWIRMEGIDLDVEESLLIDAPEGRIDIKASQLSASNDFGDGGSIALSADLIKVGAETRLLATGRENGGEVLIGGSWQNSDQTVRQALQTWMQPGSLVDASSTGQGNGGTIVIWSDLDHASGGTVAEGTFLAMGGPLGVMVGGLKPLEQCSLPILSGWMSARSVGWQVSGYWIHLISRSATSREQSLLIQVAVAIAMCCLLRQSAHQRLMSKR